MIQQVPSQRKRVLAATPFGGARLPAASFAATLFAAVLLAGMPLAPAWGASADGWLTGDAFDRRLESRAGVTWSGQPLRAALADLSQIQKTAVFLDRRVDPGQVMEFAVRGVSLESLLQQLAQQLDLVLGYVGPVAYLGPPATAAKLATVAELRNAELAAATRLTGGESLNRRKAWSWPAYTTPRELLSQIESESGLAIRGGEVIPHDVWPAADLPELSLAERLTIVLAGFDLTFQVARDGASLSLLPLPEAPSVERVYRGAKAMARIRKAIEQYPEASLRDLRDRVVVRARVETHRRLQRELQADSPPPAPGPDPKKLFSLAVNNAPVGMVLKSIAAEANLQVELAPDVDQQLNALVTLEVKNVTLEDLLSRALGPAGLKHEVRDNVLSVAPSQ